MSVGQKDILSIGVEGQVGADVSVLEGVDKVLQRHNLHLGVGLNSTEPMVAGLIDVPASAAPVVAEVAVHVDAEAVTGAVGVAVGTTVLAPQALHFVGVNEAIGIHHGHHNPVVLLAQALHLRVLGVDQLVQQEGDRGGGDPFHGVDVALKEDGLVAGTLRQFDALDVATLVRLANHSALQVIVGSTLLIDPIVDGVQGMIVLPLHLVIIVDGGFVKQPARESQNKVFQNEV